jgi:hypothetical protein
MVKVRISEISDFIGSNIQVFHKRRLDSLSKLHLEKVLKRKNPYLFKAKNINAAGDLVKSILDAHLSSQEEGIFGDFMEQVAVFVCEKSYGGVKSGIEGIDLEFEKQGTRYLVSIKSGPNWGNSRQISKMRDDFRRAQRIIGTSTPRKRAIAVNGCCYGKDDNPDKGDYLKLCGQRFWELISGNKNIYTEIIEPLGQSAKAKNEMFLREYDKVVNRFTAQFIRKYCERSGSIKWKKLVKFNSGKTGK